MCFDYIHVAIFWLDIEPGIKCKTIPILSWTVPVGLVVNNVNGLVVNSVNDLVVNSVNACSTNVTCAVVKIVEREVQVQYDMQGQNM
jgi:hypothetical protein